MKDKKNDNRDHEETQNEHGETGKDAQEINTKKPMRDLKL